MIELQKAAATIGFNHTVRLTARQGRLAVGRLLPADNQYRNSFTKANHLKEAHMQGSNKQAVAVTAVSTAAAAAPPDQHHSERSTRSRATWLSNVRHKRLAVIPALAALAMLAAPVTSASAATPLTGLTLSGTATTTSGSAFGYGGPYCPPPVSGASVTFNESGTATATGPNRYAGDSFVETQGSASAVKTIIHNMISRLNLAVPFKITSPDGTTTITGSFIHVQYTLQPWFLQGVTFICGFPLTPIAGLSVNTTAPYTATIQVGDGAPQPVSGQATVSARLYAKPGAQGSLTATFG